MEFVDILQFILFLAAYAAVKAFQKWLKQRFVQEPAAGATPQGRADGAVAALSAGAAHGVLVYANGGVATFGVGGHGQLGHGAPTDEVRPRKVMELVPHRVRVASCGAAHTLFLHYARGVAFGATADVPSGRAEERAFLALLKQIEPGHRRKHNVDIVQMGEVAAEVLAAELLYREGACEQAFGRLEAGVARSMQHERHHPPALPPSRPP